MSNPIERYAPAVAAAMAAVGAARTALDIDLLDPRVELFADQFGVDVSVIDDDLRRRFLEATGPTAFEVTQAIYVDDYWPRIVIASGEVLGGGTWVGGGGRRAGRALAAARGVHAAGGAARHARPGAHRAGPAPRRPPARVPAVQVPPLGRGLDAGADEAVFDAVDALRRQRPARPPRRPHWR